VDHSQPVSLALRHLGFADLLRVGFVEDSARFDLLRHLCLIPLRRKRNSK
jgi:hypothetical protein